MTKIHFTTASNVNASWRLGPSDNDNRAAASADRAIPSIEENSSGSSDSNSTTDERVRAGTPSVSLTPPPATTDPDDNTSCDVDTRGKAVLRGGRRTESIDALLGNMRLGSPDSGLSMPGVADAIEHVARGSDSQAALSEPRDLDIVTQPSNHRASRRRSSSRTNLACHDVNDEEPPEDRFHQPAFQKAFDDAKKLMSQLKDVLGSSSLHVDPDTTMQRLHRKAGDLAQFQCPSTRTVGFVGDSGVGKSSLLNSLLDFRGLARTSNSGAACTCVVTEYYYHGRTDFAIEVELFSMSEVTDQLAELLKSYRHYHLNGIGMEADEKKDFEAKAGVAQDTFRAMFRGRMESEEFLTSLPEDSALGILQDWTQDMSPSEIGGRHVKSTLADCSVLLMQLTSEQTATQEPAVWPYIRKIKVFSKAHILSKGLVLVDLPGLRDLNSARRNITERYLLQCDEIFAICHIGRATTDVGVMSVFELARQARLSNVGIICTKSDDIRAEEAKKDWKGQRARTIQRLIDAVATDRRDLEAIEMELAEYADDDDLLEEEKDQERELHRRARNAKKRMGCHEFELKRYLVNTRNASVMEQLENFYRSRASGGGLKVFCISNADYWEHRDLPKDLALPILQLSGILAVRKHCISMVANSQLRIATKYIRDDIPALFGDIELWIQSGAGSVSAERKQAVREILDALEARMKKDLSGGASQIDSISRSAKREFREQLYGKRRIYDWSQAASNAGYEWSQWHHSTYAAFCRNYGDYCTQAAGSHNWNEEAIERMAGDMATPWQDLRSTLQNQHEQIIGLIEEVMDWAVQYLDTELQEFSASKATLAQALTSRHNLMIADVEDVCEKFEGDLATLRTDALSGIRSSLIGQAMEDSYRSCNRESGRGSDSRRKQIINSKLESESLFEDLMKEFKNRFNILVGSLQSGVQNAVGTHLDILRETLDIVRNENIALESEQDPEFRGRVEARIGSAKDEIQRIQAIVGC